MAGKNDNFDALMAMMALKHIMDDTKDIEIHPFTCEVTVTPTSISCSSSGNKAFLEDIDGGMEWAEETNNLIKDIMSEQTIKAAMLRQESHITMQQNWSFRMPELRNTTLIRTSKSQPQKTPYRGLSTKRLCRLSLMPADVFFHRTGTADHKLNPHSHRSTT